MAIVGGNGAGKSTLLWCVVGSDSLDEGVIQLGGVELDESRAATRAAMASLLDDVDFFPDLSVAEHLQLLAWLHGTERAESVVESVVDDLGLRRIRDQLPPTLSSGQRHRLGLASCFVRPFDLLVLDELEQRLDAVGRDWLRGRLLAETSRGRGIVFASHDEALVAAVADRVVEVGM